jgi:hypothetical protein
MKIGLVGKPNAGKTTFFKAMTLVDAKIGNFPFTTIDPNIGFGFVRVKCVEEEFKVKCNPNKGYCIEGNRFIPIELIDVAGLVPDAHLGKGMGNKFLDDLRRADALIHVVDSSGTTDEEGKECEEHNPLKDIEFLENELNKWFLSILDRNWKKIDNTKDIAKQLSGLKVSLNKIQKICKELDLNENTRMWKDKEKIIFGTKLREETQPIIIAANKIDKLKYNKWLDKLIEKGAIPCSAEAELALREASKHKLIKYIPGDNDFKIIGKPNHMQKQALEKIRSVLKKYNSTGLQKILNKIVFEILNYLVVYPVSKNLTDKDGNILPDAFLMPQDSTALDLAYKIHKDFGDKFISAINMKTKQRLGKYYKLKNNDVVEIIVGR